MNLAAVEDALRAVQARFPRINNLLAGCAYVDALVTAGTDVFALAGLRHLLELNAGRRTRATWRATERRFYEERMAGVGDLIEWYAQHATEPAWRRAAGAYVRVLSTPQLFVEGNHRSGELIMSYVLLRDGLPPFVLSVRSAPAYFEASTTIRQLHKRGPTALFRAPRWRRRLAALLKAEADPRYLRG